MKKPIEQEICIIYEDLTGSYREICIKIKDCRRFSDIHLKECEEEED